MALLPPIINPGIPYVGPIDRGFTPGEMVRIQGKTLPNTQRFSINLQCGPNRNPRDDIALHVSVRVADNYLVLNTLESNQWGSEQIPKVPLPIGPDQHFEILLLCDDNDYKIAINGQHFAEFIHKLDGSRVTHLSIDGDIEISLICYEGGTPTLPETSKEAAGVTYAETPKDSDLTMDDFKPTAPVNPGYRLPPSTDDFGAPPGYGGPTPQGGPGYGPPGGPGYGPPGGPGYGPPGGQGYGGPPQGGYNFPPGPSPGQGGYGPQHKESEGKGMFEDILGQAGTAIAGALASGAIMNMLGGQNQPAQHGPIGGGYPGYQGPGGGPLSNLLSSLTQGSNQNQGGGGGGGSGGILGGLLSSALSQPQHGGGQQGYQGQQQGGGGGGGLGDFLSGAFNQIASGGQNRRY